MMEIPKKKNNNGKAGKIAQNLSCHLTSSFSAQALFIKVGTFHNFFLLQRMRENVKIIDSFSIQTTTTTTGTLTTKKWKRAVKMQLQVIQDSSLWVCMFNDV